MKALTRSRGSALLAAIVFAAVALLVANFILKVVFSRVNIYAQSRDHQYYQIASTSALNELNSCFFNANPWPPVAAPSCPTWTCPNANTCWKTITQVGNSASGVTQNIQICLTATWPAANLQVDACPFSGTCPTACP